MTHDNLRESWNEGAGSALANPKAESAHSVLKEDPEWVASRFLYSLKCVDMYFTHRPGMETMLLQKYSRQKDGVNICGALIEPLTARLGIAERDADSAYIAEHRRVGGGKDTYHPEFQTQSRIHVIENFVKSIKDFFDYPVFLDLPQALMDKLAEVNQALGRKPEDLNLDQRPEAAFFALAERYVTSDPNQTLSLEENRIVLLHVIEVFNTPFMYAKGWEFPGVISKETHGFATINHRTQPMDMVINLKRALEDLPKSFFETFADAKRLGLLNVGGTAISLLYGGSSRARNLNRLKSPS